MTKKELKAKLQAQYDDKVDSMLYYSRMNDEDLLELGKSFKESLHDQSAYPMLSYRNWKEAITAMNTIEETAKLLGIKLDTY